MDEIDYKEKYLRLREDINNLIKRGQERIELAHKCWTDSWGGEMSIYTGYKQAMQTMISDLSAIRYDEDLAKKKDE